MLETTNHTLSKCCFVYQEKIQNKLFYGYFVDSYKDFDIPQEWFLESLYALKIPSKMVWLIFASYEQESFEMVLCVLDPYKNYM